MGLTSKGFEHIKFPHILFFGLTQTLQIKILSLGGVTKKVYISNDQINVEKGIIYEWLFRTNDCSDLKEIIWNGHSLYSKSPSGKIEYIGSRNDLMDHIEELKSIPREEISEKITLKKKEKDYGFNF